MAMPPRTSGRDRSPAKEGGKTGVEKELDRLQREYRFMEVDRKQYGDSSQMIIRKQRATIERWKKENEHIKAELAAVEARQQAEESDAVMTKALDEGRGKVDNYQAQINKEQAHILERQKEIRLMTRKMATLRERMGGVNAAAENNHATQKQIKVLENRLDKALVKFNESLSHNKKLREQIDNLRQERVVFDGIYKKLEKELVEKKKKMAEIIDVSNGAYDARDRDQDKMNKLKEQHLRMMNGLEDLMMNMNRQLKYDRRAKTFVAVKETDRTATHGDGKRSKSAKSKPAWTLPKKKNNTDAQTEQVQTYEEAFDKIQAATLISDIDELVGTFIEVEDQNFSLFNFVNDLQNEMEKLEEQIGELKKEIEQAKAKGESMDNERKDVLRDLTQRLAKTEHKADQYEEKYNSTMKIMASLKGGIHSIFNKIGCSTKAINEMLGDQGVTESNMMQYLAIIEERTNEIIRQTASLALRAADEPEHDRRRAPLPSVGKSARVSPSPKIKAPSTYVGDGASGDDDASEESDEDSQRPWTRDELKSKSMKGLSAKKAAAEKGKKGGKKKTGPAGAPKRRKP